MRFVLMSFIDVAAKSITFMNTCHLMMSEAQVQPEKVVVKAEN